MTERSFVENEFTNHNYIEYQKKVLDQIKVMPTKQILKPSYFNLLQDNLNLKGEKKISISDNDQLILHGNENGIFIMIDVQKDKYYNPQKEEPIHTVRNYFIIDTKTDKAFNASTIWKQKSLINDNDHSNSDTSVVLNPKLGESGFIPSWVGGIIEINDLNEDQSTQIGNISNLTPNQIKLFNITSLFHESGHKYQFRQNTPPTKTADPKQELLISLYEIPFKWFYKKETVLSMEKLKSDISQKERNATSFSLAVIRKLKSQGLDLTRGLTNKEVYQAVDWGLNSYEKKFSKINGPKIAQIKK